MIAFITSFISQTIVYTTIYTLASLGILIAGRAGIFNIAGEGIMLAAASSGLIVSSLTGNWFWGFLFGALVGGAFGLTLVFIHETFRINQFIVGMVLVIFGLGLSDLIYKGIVGVRLLLPLAPSTPEVRIPLLSRIPIVSGFLNHDVIVYFMYGATLATWWFFYKTKEGLETRAIGENPKAADVVGINVRKRRYIATVIGSALIGVAGVYLPMIITGTYMPNIAGGRGFMAIGIVIFASWKPHVAIIGGFGFAAIEAVAYQLQIISTSVPYQFFLMLPFLSVLAVMVILKKYVEFPASVGELYSRE